MQTGLIRPEDLTRKYTQELFANEIVLLSYYIAAVNIESVYREVCEENGIEPAAGGFEGISLTDTFAMDERDSQLAGGVFPENTARLEKQRATDISVIVMNPPYRAQQANANDSAQNAQYLEIDSKITATYANRSAAGRKVALYDSYFRALRWATDRIGDQGVIAFVSNSGFIDGGTADGVRQSWSDEFSEVVVYNLRGNARHMGEARKREAGNVFGAGTQTGVAITVLVKDRSRAGAARIHYADIGDYLSREDKLDRLRSERSMGSTDFVGITPNNAGDWINQRDERFSEFQPTGDKVTKGRIDTPAVFRDFSLGLATNRDAWAYNFSGQLLRANIQTHVAHLNAERERVHALIATGDDRTADELLIRDSFRGSWDRVNLADLKRNRETVVEDAGFRVGQYRPFVKLPVYFDRAQRLNNCTYQLPAEWPTSLHTNVGIAVNVRGGSVPILVANTPDLHVNGDSQVFPRYTWEPATAPDGALNLDALAVSDSDEVVDGYRRVDNITDATLEAYRKVHGDAITKDDIFYGIYALLHHPTYRETYAADLQKMLPRIPQVKSFLEYARIGRELADLHVDYESVPQADLGEQPTSIDPPTDPYELYRIDKLAWISRKDHTAIRYNAHLTITGIPLEESEYKVGGRSPLEWVLDRYMVKVDKASGIVNDPNAWLREQGNPRYVVDLIRSLVTVSIETQRLIAQLPAFEVIEP